MHCSFLDKSQNLLDWPVVVHFWIVVQGQILYSFVVSNPY